MRVRPSRLGTSNQELSAALPDDPRQPADLAQVDPQDEVTVRHTSARKRRGLPPTKMTLNLTAMIDVIFQLLVYFVVTASFVIGEGVITAKLPAGDASPKQNTKPPDRPITIVISPARVFDYSLRIEGLPQRPANFSELQKLLISLQYDPERARNGVYKPDNPIIIKPEGEVRWQHVVNAFNSAIVARYTNVSFAKAE